MFRVFSAISSVFLRAFLGFRRGLKILGVWGGFALVFCLNTKERKIGALQKASNFGRSDPCQSQKPFLELTTNHCPGIADRKGSRDHSALSLRNATEPQQLGLAMTGKWVIGESFSGPKNHS